MVLQKKRMYKKKYNKRQNKEKNANSIIVKGPNIIPDRYVCKMPYVFTTTITSVSGAIGTNIYRGNGPYDPLQPVGGDQPLGYDQLSALYNRYYVSGCAINVTVLPNTEDTSSICDMVLFPSSGTVVSANNDQNAEQPYSRRIFTNLASSRGTQINHYMSTASMYGISKEKARADDAYTALNSTTPVNQWYWLLNAQSPDRTSSEVYIYKVKITYYVEWYDRVKLTGS